LAVTEDLPTPPLPEATAMTLVSESAAAKGISISGLPAPFSARRSAESFCRSSSVIDPKWTCTSSTPSSRLTASVTSRVMRSLRGQPGIVSLIRTPTRLPSIAISSTIPSSVMGLSISGSLTVARIS